MSYILIPDLMSPVAIGVTSIGDLDMTATILALQKDFIDLEPVNYLSIF